MPRCLQRVFERYFNSKSRIYSAFTFLKVLFKFSCCKIRRSFLDRRLNYAKCPEDSFIFSDCVSAVFENTNAISHNGCATYSSSKLCTEIHCKSMVSRLPLTPYHQSQSQFQSEKIAQCERALTTDRRVQYFDKRILQYCLNRRSWNLTYRFESRLLRFLQGRLSAHHDCCLWLADL